jgi:monofunctional biosynthetic peptidoglycan transglycosylase
MATGQPRSLVVRLLKAAILVLVVLIALPYLIAPLYLFGHPVSTLMLWRQATGARVERVWVPLEAIAPVLPHSVIAAEDGGYCRHHGVDFGALREVWQEADDISEMRGGSTIAQQTAKNLFLWPGRSVVRKALELPLALWLDLVLGKRRLMEIYLNIAEWGPTGEFGIEAGARRAFNKGARDLNPREAALLAAVLPNPYHRNAARPGPGVRRLGALYEARARNSATVADCLKAGARR